MNKSNTYFFLVPIQSLFLLLPSSRKKKDPQWLRWKSLGEAYHEWEAKQQTINLFCFNFKIINDVKQENNSISSVSLKSKRIENLIKARHFQSWTFHSWLIELETNCWTMVHSAANILLKRVSNTFSLSISTV